jgi:hypothetical protein
MAKTNLPASPYSMAIDQFHDTGTAVVQRSFQQGTSRIAGQHQPIGRIICLAVQSSKMLLDDPDKCLSAPPEIRKKTRT